MPRLCTLRNKAAARKELRRRDPSRLERHEDCASFREVAQAPLRARRRTLDSPSETLLRATALAAPATRRSAEPPCVIAISREAESGAGDVAAEISRLLGWPIYDHELLDLIATDMGVKSKLLQTADER